MKRHKLDVYVDASNVDNTIGIGIKMFFDDWECFSLGTVSRVESTHPEVAELVALQRTLQRLVGGREYEFFNTDITVYMDNLRVIQYFNNGIDSKTFPDNILSCCEKLFNNLTDSHYNNKITLKKICRDYNKAHNLAYNAAVKGTEEIDSEIYKARKLSK